MPKRKIEALEDVKKNYVRMAIESGNYASTARRAGVDAKTLKKWMNEYGDEIREQMEDPNTFPIGLPCGLLLKQWLNQKKEVHTSSISFQATENP
ncbi:hypothetical protein A8F94_15945 [Bacillus sp. FJAT-27225]|uniref:hypothetical protein n=1 Tax=Bacillus sp. FJAT-27225 TaxID=1743144 RepID=UPI00080C270F|nr:hypothetical protein [Bacillus sp. FJAT-27225]OCA84207.1 hypothetical protein A8F94_15945 [Bacillus sp. FJAT-27225]